VAVEAALSRLAGELVLPVLSAALRAGVDVAVPAGCSFTANVSGPNRSSLLLPSGDAVAPRSVLIPHSTSEKAVGLPAPEAAKLLLARAVARPSETAAPPMMIFRTNCLP
jgi:hypothetical protein